MRFWQVTFFSQQFNSKHLILILIYCHILFCCFYSFMLSHHKLFDSLSWSSRLVGRLLLLLWFQKDSVNRLLCIKCIFLIFHSFCSHKKKSTFPNLLRINVTHEQKHTQLNWNEVLLVCNIHTCQKTHTETVFLQLANNNQP